MCTGIIDPMSNSKKKNPMQGLIGRSVAGAQTHPIIAAAVASELTRRTGGSTVNAHTNEVTVSPGGEGYAIGGVRGTRSHKRIKTKVYDRESDGGMRPDLWLSARNRVRHLASGMVDANVGTWGQGGKIEVDASEIDLDLERSLKKGRARKEKAIHAFEPGKDINLR